MNFKLPFAIAAICLQASFAHAGGLADTVETSDVIVVPAEPSSSAADIVVPLILLALLATAASGGTSAGNGDGLDGGDLFEGSDIRLKENIVPVGTAHNGLALYHFSYLNSDVRYEGVMAQDVLSYMPQAVARMPNGYLAVNYDMLGLKMTVVE